MFAAFQKFIWKSASFIGQSIQEATFLKGLIIISFDGQTNQFLMHASQPYQLLYNRITQQINVWYKKITEIDLLAMHNNLELDYVDLQAQIAKLTQAQKSTQVTDLWIGPIICQNTSQGETFGSMLATEGFIEIKLDNSNQIFLTHSTRLINSLPQLQRVRFFYRKITESDVFKYIQTESIKMVDQSTSTNQMFDLSNLNVEEELRILNTNYEWKQTNSMAKFDDYILELERMKQNIDVSLLNVNQLRNQQLMICYSNFLTQILENYQKFKQRRQSDIYKFQQTLEPSPDKRFSCVGYCKIDYGDMYVAECRHYFHRNCFKQLIRYELDQQYPHLQCKCGEILSKNKALIVFDDEFQIENDTKQYKTKNILMEQLCENQIKAITDKYPKQIRRCAQASCKYIYWGSANDSRYYVCQICPY